MASRRYKIAIIGGGVAGISAAHYLSQNNDVTLFEKNDRLGGHTNTIHFEDQGSKAVDTGFIVFNEKNYPHFCQLLKDWGVESQESTMSFAFNRGDQFYYAGTGLGGLFAQKRNVLSIPYYKFLKDILDFGKKAKKALSQPHTIEGWTLKDVFRNWKVSQRTIDDYIIPMGAAIWSGSFEKMQEFPALSYFHFFENHGLLTFKDRPQWRTIKGGSSTYIQAFLKQFQGRVITGAKIEPLVRKNEGVRVVNKGLAEYFDHVVLAVHADQVLPLLCSPSEKEKELFQKWSYSKNETFLHKDVSLMPANKKAWAAWNYHQNNKSSPVAVTYDMNRLQSLKDTKNYLVTLNPAGSINPQQTIYSTMYEHPQYDLDSFATQKQIQDMSGMNNTWFCGSYLGYGFHEDAVRSSFQMSQKLEAEW